MREARRRHQSERLADGCIQPWLQPASLRQLVQNWLAVYVGERERKLAIFLVVESGVGGEEKHDVEEVSDVA